MVKNETKDGITMQITFPNTCFSVVVLEKPTFLRPKVLNSTSVNISWIPVQTTDGEIDRYELSYWPRNNKFFAKILQLAPTTNQTVVTGLRPKTRYYFQMQAIAKNSSDGLRGMPSPKSYLTHSDTPLIGKRLYLSICLTI